MVGDVLGREANVVGRAWSHVVVAMAKTPQSTMTGRLSARLCSTRMVPPVVIVQLLLADVSVDLRGHDVRVPEQLLDRSQIGAALQ